MDGSAGVGVDEVAQKRAASTLAVVPENPPDSRGFVVAAFPSHPQTSRRATSSAGHRPSPCQAACRCSLVSPPTAVRASHGVGLLHRLAGLEGTYAVLLTAPDTYLQQLLDATSAGEAPALVVTQYQEG